MKTIIKIIFLVLMITKTAYSTPWGPMYLPVEEFPNYDFTGTIIYLRTYSDNIQNILQEAEQNHLKLILSLGNPNPCAYLTSEEGPDNNDTCHFSRPHQIGRIDTQRIKEELSDFIQHRELFQEYIQKGVIIGIRIFDEPHDRDCSPYGYSQYITIAPQDLDEIYQNLYALL